MKICSNTVSNFMNNGYFVAFKCLIIDKLDNVINKWKILLFFVGIVIVI